MNRSENICPPRRATVDSVEARNVQYVAITTSSARTLVDPRLRMRWVRIKAIGADVTFCFSNDNAGTVDHSLSGAQAVSADIGYKLAAGEYDDFLLGGQDNYIIVDGSASGTLLLLGAGSRVNSKEGP